MDAQGIVEPPVVFTDVFFYEEYMEEYMLESDEITFDPMVIYFDEKNIDFVFDMMRERGVSWSSEAEKRIRDRVKINGSAEVV